MWAKQESVNEDQERCKSCDGTEWVTVESLYAQVVLKRARSDPAMNDFDISQIELQLEELSGKKEKGNAAEKSVELVPHPGVPLPCEGFSGTGFPPWPGCGNEGCTHPSCRPDLIDTFDGSWDEEKAAKKIGAHVAKAHYMALRADTAEMAREAMRAACEGPCPQGHILLAFLESPTLNEALGHYDCALADAEQLVALAYGSVALCASKFEWIESRASMWDDPIVRPWFRAQLGMANTLRKLGRYEEAVSHYMRLVKADGNNWNPAQLQGGVNYRYYIMQCFHLLGRPAEVVRFALETCRAVIDHCFMSSATLLAFGLDFALADYKVHFRFYAGHNFFYVGHNYLSHNHFFM